MVSLLLAGSLMLTSCGSMLELALDMEALAAEMEAAQDAQAAARSQEPPIPRNVILIIGDGMGVPQVYASVVASERWWRAALERDRRKISYALANNIDIYIIPYWDQPILRRAADLFQDQYHAKSRWHNDEIRMKLPHK